MPPSSSRISIPWHTLIVAALTLGLLWVVLPRPRHARGLGRGPRRAVDAHRDRRAVGLLDVRAAGLALAASCCARLVPPGSARHFARRSSDSWRSRCCPRASAKCCAPTCSPAGRTFTPASTFATVIVERLLDMASVLLLFAIALPFGGVEVARSVKVAGLVFGAIVRRRSGAPLHPRRPSRAARTLGGPADSSSAAAAVGRAHALRRAPSPRA